MGGIVGPGWRAAETIDLAIASLERVKSLRMTQIETLSRSSPTPFAELWYDIAGDDHFWLRARFAFFLRAVRNLGLDPRTFMTGLDIGCGHGAVQRQLAAHTAWRADGCDLNQAALSLHSGNVGRVLFYDTNDRRAEFREKYDFLVLFDVIEHIEKTTPFIEAAAYHLKPGGYVFVNVPACQRLYSRYDTAAGHYRRYDKKLLHAHLTEAGLTVSSLRYWGMLLLPALIARNVYVSGKSSSSEVIRGGFHPPNPLSSALLSAAIACEMVLPAPPIGTSLLAIARKPIDPGAR
jgi:2-polyprenyl-3-methyl-5-hydroxy-6-metoxy-1,4-benzoquinol methylase